MEYDTMDAIILAIVLEEMAYMEYYEGTQHSQQYTLEQGLKKFGKRGVMGIKKEMHQLDDRICFALRHVKSLTKLE